MPLTDEQTAKIRELQIDLCIFPNGDPNCGACERIRRQIAAIQAEAADGAGMASEDMMTTSDG